MPRRGGRASSAPTSVAHTPQHVHAPFSPSRRAVVVSRRGVGPARWPRRRCGAPSRLPREGLRAPEGAVKLKGVIGRFQRDCAAFGLWNTLQAFGIRAIQRVLRIRVLRAMYVTAVAPTFAAVPADLTAGFLDRATLRRLSAHAQYDLSPGFLDAALGKGDECYAVMDGARLAAYGWYARTPTDIGDDLEVHFDDAYVYMYKGLTLDAYRGRRLHAVGKAGALAVYRALGYKGLV